MLRWNRRVALCASLLTLAACSGPASPPPPPPKLPVLSIGLLPEQNIFRQLERYEPLAAYVGRKAGVKLKLVPLPRYGNIIDSLRGQNLDGAFFGSFTYALAHSALGIEAIARPEQTNGLSTYHGLILVRRDGGIRGAADLRGKRFAFVDKATTAGYLLPLDYFARAGIRNVEAFLGEAYFAGTHEDVIHDVFDRKADAGAAKNTVYEKLVRDDPRLAQDLEILAQSPEVPENALGLRPGVDESLRRKIREALLAMDRDPEGQKVLEQFGARRFIATVDADYEPVYRYAREVGLELGHLADVR